MRIKIKIIKLSVATESFTRYTQDCLFFKQVFSDF